MAGINRNRWPDCSGISGRNESEWVAAFGRNLQWDIKPENVILTDYFLSNGKQNEYNFKNFKLDQIQDNIKKSIVEMIAKLDDPQENITRENSFPFTENEQICKYCNYYKACPKYG